MANSNIPMLPSGWLAGDPRVLGPNTWSDGERVVTRLGTRKRRQALYFYRVIAPQLQDAGARTPTLLDAQDSFLLRTWHAGAGDVGLDAHRAAGRWLRTLHSVGKVPLDPLPLDLAIAKRIAALLPVLPERWRGPLQALDLSPVRELSRVWCHRDLHPRNWLWDGERLVVFDFEHSAPDLAAMDWVRVPERGALVEGYGGLKEQEEAALRVADFLNAAGTLAWGLRHEDPHWVFTGQQRLRALIPIG